MRHSRWINHDRGQRICTVISGTRSRILIYILGLPAAYIVRSTLHQYNTTMLLYYYYYYRLLYNILPLTPRVYWNQTIIIYYSGIALIYLRVFLRGTVVGRALGSISHFRVYDLLDRAAVSPRPVLVQIYNHNHNGKYNKCHVYLSFYPQYNRPMSSSRVEDGRPVLYRTICNE